MNKKYISSVRQLTARPRSKRLREQGSTIVGGGSVHVSVEGGASSATDPNSHKHTNLDVLERISTDDQDYICLNQYVEDEETDGFSVKKERAKVGFADMAGALAEEAMKKLMEMLSNHFLYKDQPDTAAELITFLKGLFSKDDVIIGTDGYAEGLTGFGTKFGRDGSGEMSRLTLRHELRVPSLVFNQTEVNVGDKWRAPGGGVIEKVFPDVDENGNLLNTGTFLIKLEKGQIGAVFTNAICMGIFHDWQNDENNATEDSDDSRGNRTYAGFTTSYFTIIEISDYTDDEGVTYHRKLCRYQIRPVSERWSGQAHPYEQMNFVCYGIFSSDTEMLKKYGTSVYETRTYRRMLWNQNTWEISAANIAYQDGDLSNLNIHGMNMVGYSAYLNSVYFTGTIKQVKPDGTPVQTANDRGEWKQGTPYAFYDRVSWNGGLWLCINENGTNTEPKEGDSSWLCQVKPGTSIKPYGRWESKNVPYPANSIVTFADKVWISNKDTSEPPFGTYMDKDSNRLVYKDGNYVLVETLIQSEDWNLLLDAPQLTDGKDGESLQVRYSSDKSNWHAFFIEGDVWMQQRVGEGSIWSDPIRIAGEAGAAGADGTYYDYQFAVNSSLDVAPTTGWQDTPPAVGIGQYLWMRTRFVNPNTQEENPWSVVRIGGEKGRGVELVIEYYAVSSSNTEAPTTWVEGKMPEMTETLKYLWNYEKVIYNDTEEVATNPIVIGMYSKDGNGIKNVVETYGLTNNSEEKPLRWYSDMPIPTQEARYLWNKTVTEYTDGNHTEIVHIIAVHGETGDGIVNLGAWKNGMAVPVLGMVTMGGNSFIAKVATYNPPMWVYTDKDANRLAYKDGGYILTGELNEEEYDLLIQAPKDGRDGKGYEYIFAHTSENKQPSKPASVQVDDYIPSGWHDDAVGVSESLPYEWVCLRTKKDGVWSDYSTPSIWAKFGKDGSGINSVTVSYGKSNSASVMPTSWSSNIPSVDEGEYLWTREITDYTDPTMEDTVVFSYTHQGKTGQAGSSVSVKSIQYQAGSSSTSAPTGTWSNSVVQVTQGLFLWTKTTFSDGSVAYGVARQGEDGEGFTLMGNWHTGLAVPKLGVVRMGDNMWAANEATNNPPMWCWTDKDGNRLVFSETEYVLTGEINSAEYEWYGGKGEKGDKGDKGQDGVDGKVGADGKQGIQGCVVRDSEWVLGTQYRNDEALTSGTRYIDVVLVRNDSAATGWDAYKCKVTHTSSADKAPGNTTYWEEFGANVTTIFTSLIIAKNAKIRFLQGNQLLMQKDNGTITAGLSGSEDGDKTRIWAGSGTPDNAPFAVNEEGVTTSTKFRTARSGRRMEAVNGVISMFGSKSKNIEFGVNDEGLAVLRYYDNDGTLLYDLGPAGLKKADINGNRWVTTRLTYSGSSVNELFGSYWSKVKNPTYDTGADVYQFLSAFINNAYINPDADRKFYKIKTATEANYITDGWYVYTLADGAQKDTVDTIPTDMNTNNPSVSGTKTIYVSHAIRVEGGKIIESLNAYYN